MADNNSVTLITMINQLNDLLKDVASSSENLEDGPLENQTSAEEKAFQRKLIEIHLRLKCATNYSSDEDEEAFFEDVTVCNFVATIRPDDGQPDTGEQAAEEEGLTIHGVPISFGKVRIQKMVELLKCCKVVFGELYDLEATPRKLKFTDDSHAMAAQLLAELARSVSGRYLMIREGIVPAVGLLLQENVAESLDEEVQRCNDNTALCSVETAVQICRVLGNLCYDSGEGCFEIEKQTHLIPRLAILAQSRASRPQEDPGQRLPVVLPGFLANLISCSDTSMLIVGENGLIEVLLSYILSTKTNDAVFSACIKFFTDAMSDPYVTPYILKAEQFADAWIHILENTTSAEILTSLFRATSVIKTADVSLKLLKNFKILEIFTSEVMGRWNTSDDYLELRQEAFRSVIELLRFSECVTYIYKETGDKYPNLFTSWIHKVNDLEAVCAGADALKYFAAEEQICMELMEKPDNFVDRLIEILVISPGRPHPSSLLFRVLDPINLVAHYQKVRPYLINKGLPSIIAHLFVHTYVDLFANFIHTFIFMIMRLLSNGSPETTKYFITAFNKGVLRKSISLANEHLLPPHLRINAPRFFAALLKNCRSIVHFKILIEEGTLAIINTNLLFHERILYVNEALLGLSVVSAALTSGPCDETDENALLIHRHLHMDLVINGIKRVFQEQDPLKIPVEIKLNAVALMEFLLKANRDAFKKMLQDLHFVEECLDENSLSNLPPKFSELAKSINS